MGHALHLVGRHGSSDLPEVLRELCHGRNAEEGEMILIDTAPFPWSREDYRTMVLGQIIGEPSAALLERVDELWREGVPPEQATGALYDGRDD